MAKHRITAKELRAVLVRHNGNREHAAAELCVTVQHVRTLIRRYQGDHCKFPKSPINGNQCFKPEWSPTPEEIAASMQAIRRMHRLPPIDEIRVAKSIRDDMQ